MDGRSFSRARDSTSLSQLRALGTGGKQLVPSFGGPKVGTTTTSQVSKVTERKDTYRSQIDEKQMSPSFGGSNVYLSKAIINGGYDTPTFQNTPTFQTAHSYTEDYLERMHKVIARRGARKHRNRRKRRLS